MDIRAAIERRPWIWAWVCVLVTALKLWLVSAQTIHAIAPSPADDELFLSTAIAILRGEWLGAFSDLTLAKGPIYPLWLALNHLTGAPLLFSQAILYAVACAVLARAVRPVIPTPSQRALVYVAVLLNPGTWATTRVVREGIYSSLSLLVLGFAIGSALRLREAPRRGTLWAIAAGFTGALFANTREEGAWLAPSLAIIALVGIVSARRCGWRTWLLPAACAAAAYAVPTIAIAAANWKHYGVFETCETSAQYFRSAYGALTRVKTQNWNPYVPVSREARSALYAQSPAFRSIGLQLEASAPVWTTHGCESLNVCDDIAGGWFQWALRAAASRAGKYQDGLSARTWYEQVTREIDDACRDGRLDCLPSRSTLMPPWRAEYLRPFLSALGRAAVFITTFGEVTPYPIAPEANEPDIVRFEQVTNEQLPRPVVLMRGIVASRVGQPGAVVFDPTGRPTAASIKVEPVLRTERPSVDGVSITRFTFETSCAGANCRLVLLDRENRPLRVVPMKASTRVSGEHEVVWTTEMFQHGIVPTSSDESRMRRLSVLATITRAYGVCTPALLAVALVALLLGLGRALRARAFPDLLLVSTGLLAGVCVRLVLLSLIEVTSFRGISVLYCAPAYGLLVAFVALVLGDRLPAPASKS